MKKLPLICLLLSVLSCTSNTESWTLTCEDSSLTVADVSVPCTVAGALAEDGYWSEDPVSGLNYKSLDRSIFDSKWTFSRSYRMNPEKDTHYFLQLGGLNYYADIFWNGTCLASADTTCGVFVDREFDITPYIKKGANKLSITLSRAQAGDLNHGFVDWNPRPLDESMGILRPVVLTSSKQAVLKNIFVVPHLNVETLAEADLEVRLEVRNNEDVPYDGAVELTLGAVSLGTVPLSLAPSESRTLTLTSADLAGLHIADPRVWWTWDLGTPELYDITATLDGSAVSATFGIRDITSRISDGHLQFTLNGRDILIKGAGWTDDIFMRDTPESSARQALYVKEMNMNCIRFENIWGKDDAIYEACDELGLLALVGWSCQWEWADYCGGEQTEDYGCINSPELNALSADYFRCQVRRLRNHPSVICWLTGSDRIPNPELEQLYMEIYAVEDYRPYCCSAKEITSIVSGPSGTKMEGPYEYVAPDYWYLDTIAGGAFGFNTETCTGASIPQMESLVRFIPEDQLTPDSEAMNFHCTASSSDMNSTRKLLEVIEGQYGAPADFSDFVLKAHAVDYNATRGMFEAFRANIPQTTGIVQWMLNSAWPSLYWQLYDWYGAPTAAWYGVRKACQPVQLVFNWKDRKVYAVNEGASDVTVTASAAIYDASSVKLAALSAETTATVRQPVPVFDLGAYDGSAHFVFLSLSGAASADNFYAIPAQNNIYDWANTNWYVTDIAQYADLRFALGGGRDVAAIAFATDDGLDVRVTNSGSSVASMIVLKLLDAEGRLVTPAYWEDNFFALEPGASKTVHVRAQLPDGWELKTLNL